LKGMPKPAWIANAAKDFAVAARLWKVSEDLTGVTFSAWAPAILRQSRRPQPRLWPFSKTRIRIAKSQQPAGAWVAAASRTWPDLQLDHASGADHCTGERDLRYGQCRFARYGADVRASRRRRRHARAGRTRQIMPVLHLIVLGLARGFSRARRYPGSHRGATAATAKTCLQSRELHSGRAPLPACRAATRATRFLLIDATAA
jgi:hypothetical protein